MRPSLKHLSRAGFIVMCVFVLVRTARMGYADSLARSGQPALLASAIRMEPGNSLWAARRAAARFESGDNSPAVEQDLLRSLAARPADAEVLMPLGLIAEQQGEVSKGESYLLRACTADHRFKPAWTTANFYFRTNQFGKMWPYLEKCLALIEPKNLEPWSFDPAPIFALAWAASGDPRFIHRLIPVRRETLVPYIAFLAAEPRIENRTTQPDWNPLGAAMLAWPDVIRLAQTSDRDTLLKFLDQLVRTRPDANAVRVWNDLAARGFVPGAPLDPAAGHSLADPAFRYPRFEHGFGWRLPYSPGIVSSMAAQSVNMDFNGSELEDVTLLFTYAPVLPGRSYRMQWKFAKSPPPSLWTEVKAEGSTLLAKSGSVDANFSVPQDVRQVEVALRYKRSPGEVRLRDHVAVNGADLELLR